MKKLFALSLLPVLAGCLSASAPRVSRWALEYKGAARTAQLRKYDVGRVSQVLIRAPYGEIGIAVQRADGSMAFDPYNEYATSPVSMARGFVFDAMDASGLFGTVLNASSSAKSSALVEVLVTRLALDCRKEGERRAVAEVLVRILGDDVRSSHAKGEGVADAADGNYGAALSGALSVALDSAFGRLH